MTERAGETDKRRYYWNGFWIGLGIGILFGSILLMMPALLR